jgi:hypothetical protein
MVNKELNLKIEDLFRWKGELEITDNEGNVIETLYQRVVGDHDIQKSRIEALKASKLLRRALKDENSDEYLTSVPEEDQYTKEELIALILFSNYSIFRQQAELRVEEKKVKEPRSDSDLEEQEEYISALEEEKKSYEERLNKDISEQSEKLEKELRGKTDAEIFEIYKKNQVELLCRYRMMEIFDEFATFYGTYKDNKFKERRFETIEDFRDLAPRIKGQILENYKMLELNLGEVKK